MKVGNEMIKAFLYNTNERNNKTIVAVVEDTSVEGNTEENSFPCYPVERYVLLENEQIVQNAGEHFYLVTEDNKYLDLNMMNNKVTVGLTDKIIHAACYSKPFLAVILDAFSYFGYDDIKLVSSGYYLQKNGVEKDKFENFFRKCGEKSYCCINKEKPYFISKDENKHFILTDDFSKTVTVSKKEVRRALLINCLIDESLDRKAISFSDYNAFTNQTDYIFGGFFGFKIEYRDECEFIITTNPTITTDFKLINNEEVGNKLKDLSYLLKEANSGQSSYLEFNSKYIKLTETGFMIVANPTEASLIDLTQIKVIKRAISLYFDKPTFKMFTTNEHCYLYHGEGNNYLLSTQELNNFEGVFVLPSLFKEFNIEFIKKNYQLTAGVILLHKDKYVNAKYANYQLTIGYLDTAYNATVFTQHEAKLLSDLLQIKFSKRELEYQPDFLLANNIEKSDKVNDFHEMYKAIYDEIISGKHKICQGGNLLELKKESSKGALEYLRRLYFKAYLDAYYTFKNIVRKKKTKRIIMIGGTSNIEIQALNQVCFENDTKAEVVVVNNQVWGYNNRINISDNLVIMGGYRLTFSDLPRVVLDKADVLYFGRDFNDIGFASQINMLRENHDFLLVNIKTCNVIKNVDVIYQAFEKNPGIKRKYFHHEAQILKEAKEINEIKLTKLYATTCKCIKPFCDVVEPILGNDLSYHSVLSFKNGKIIDCLNKK